MKACILLAAGLLSLMATSCTRRSTPSSEQKTTHRSTQRDSTGTDRSYTERIRLTPVQLPADAVPFETQLLVLPSGQLQPATYSSRGKRATVQLKVDAQGKVSGECGCEAQEATIASLDREVQQMKARVSKGTDHQEEDKIIHDVVREPYTAWYDWLARFVAIGLLLLLLGLYFINRL